MNTTLQCLEIWAGDDQLDRVSALLVLHVPAGWEEETLPEGKTCFRVYHEEAAPLRQLGDALREIPGVRLRLTELPRKDWMQSWREYFTPVFCGSRFVVLPPWLLESVDFQGRMPVVIEPKSAFGTGHHETTALCLRIVSDALDRGRLRPGMRFLDLGTGSGILGLGCCRAGLTGIGTDIDPLAVENAVENRALNGVSGFTLRLGSTEAVKGEQFAVVLANILARPLQELAPEIVRLLEPGGCLILSGLLTGQADAVEAAYTALGLGMARRVVDGEWAALVWE